MDEINPSPTTGNTQPSEDENPVVKPPTWQEFSDRIKTAQVEENPFDKKKEVYQEAILSFSGGQDLSISAFEDSVKERQSGGKIEEGLNVDVLTFRDQLSKITEGRVGRIQRELDKVPEEKKEAVLGKEIADATGQELPADQLKNLLASGENFKGVLATFLKDSTPMSRVIDDLMLVHDRLKAQQKEKIQLKNLQKDIGEAIQKQAGIENKNDKGVMDLAHDLEAQQKMLAELVGEGLDKADVSGFISAFFDANSGYGSAGRSYRNGLEKRDNDKSKKTEYSLLQILTNPKKSKDFYCELLDVDSSERNEIGKEKLKSELEDLLAVDEGDKAKKEKKLEEVKKKILKAIQKIDTNRMFSSIRSVDDINLSAEVIQMLLDKLEDIPEKT